MRTAAEIQAYIRATQQRENLTRDGMFVVLDRIHVALEYVRNPELLVAPPEDVGPPIVCPHCSEQIEHTKGYFCSCGYTQLKAGDSTKFGTVGGELNIKEEEKS